MKKLNWLGNLILIAIVASSLTGCAVVRLMEVSAGIGVRKEVIDTETRRTDKIVEKDVKLIFTPIGDGLGLRLQYQPHYEVQNRSIVKYHGGGSFLSTLIGTAELLAFTFATAQWLNLLEEDEDRSFDLPEVKTNWAALKTWEKTVIIGVPSDFLLRIMTRNYKPTKRTRWKPSHTTPGRTLVGIPNHPITISLPQLGYTETYLTNSTGQLTIPTRSLIGKIPGQNLGAVLHENSIKIDASINVDGEEQQQSVTMDRSSALFRSLYKEADERR